MHSQSFQLSGRPMASVLELTPAQFLDEEARQLLIAELTPIHGRDYAEQYVEMRRRVAAGEPVLPKVIDWLKSCELLHEKQREVCAAEQEALEGHARLESLKEQEGSLRRELEAMRSLQDTLEKFVRGVSASTFLEYFRGGLTGGTFGFQKAVEFGGLVSGARESIEILRSEVIPHFEAKHAECAAELSRLEESLSNAT